MSQIKRTRLLSQLEYDRLSKRQELDSLTRARNDFRAIIKLIDWCDAAKDAVQILKSIKTERIAKHMTDDRMNDLRAVLSEVEAMKKFYSID